MKTAIELIKKESKRWQYNPGKDFANDLLILQKGVKRCIETNDPRLLEILIGGAALIAAEIDRLQNVPIPIKSQRKELITH